MSEHKTANVTAALIVSRAARILKTIGWTKGAEVRYTYDDQNRSWPSSYCLMGALNRAAHELKISTGIPILVHEVINNNTPNKDFVSFNDADSTYLQDVLALLDRSCEQLMNPPKTPPSTDDDEVGETDDESQIETDPDNSDDSDQDDQNEDRDEI